MGSKTNCSDPCLLLVRNVSIFPEADKKGRFIPFPDLVSQLLRMLDSLGGLLLANQTSIIVAICHLEYVLTGNGDFLNNRGESLLWSRYENTGREYSGSPAVWHQHQGSWSKRGSRASETSPWTQKQKQKPDPETKETAHMTLACVKM